MATVVNDRDILLQSVSPRVESAYMSDNIIVLPDQVEGLGLVIAGTKTIRLTASSQVFQIPKSGSVSPSSITLTVVRQNLTNSPVLSIIAGTVSPTPSFTGDSVTIAYADFASDVVTFRATVTEDSVTYTDDITVIKVREGEDSINVLMTNESHTVPADSLGNVLSYSGASGNIKAYRGVTDITSLCTFSLATGGNPSGLVYSIGTDGVYAVTGGMGVLVDNTTITFTTTFASTVIPKVFSLSKSKAGNDGSTGSDGADGQRGSMTFYVTITGTTFDTSLATSTASYDGGPIRNDVVTQYNSAAGFSETRFWDGSSWLVINAVVDGNLLVTGTVGADKISANAVTADKIDVINLNAVSASTGDLDVDGDITISTGGKIISSDYVAGTSGMILNPTGTSEFNDVTVRGHVEASSGTFSGTITADAGYVGGAVITADGVESDNYVVDTSGWSLDNTTGSVFANAGKIGGFTLSGNSLRQGATGFETGTGIWLGSVSGTPKFYIGNKAGGKYLSWDGTDLVLNGYSLASFTATIPSGDLTHTGAVSGSIGSRTVTVSGGQSPYSYRWIVTRTTVAISGGDVYISGGVISDNVGFSATLTVGDSSTWLATCFITDANGRVTTAHMTITVSA